MVNLRNLVWIGALATSLLALVAGATLVPEARADATERSSVDLQPLERSVVELQASCGDGRCQPPEDCNSCPSDCGSCCGDGRCAPPEDCNSCPRDCGGC